MNAGARNARRGSSSDNFYLRFWGVRGSHSSPLSTHLGVGGNTSCVELFLGGDTVLCDAGTGIIEYGKYAMAQEDSSRKLLLLLTHYHWDHICGLPFFTPAFLPNWNISIFAPGETVVEVKRNIDSQMQTPYFPVGTEVWMANLKYLEPYLMEINYGNSLISRFSVRHPGQTYGYRIRARGNDIVYISDNECSFYDSDQDDQTFSRENSDERQLLEKIKEEEYRSQLRMIQDADILIHDAQYLREEYEIKRGWGHSCYEDIVNVAIDANVKNLYLYHHDPEHDDGTIKAIHKDSKKIISRRKSNMHCFVAREGMQVDFGA
ncbi:MAG: MBL fold metallo-hydrolase [Candidatus Eutrophobiaceae bacterium]